ncbi:MAG: OmpA family protein [uncultured bacterium]|nr:MAG: OmpA family protein [uncultured bacterium]
MERISRRKFWLLFCFLIGIATVYVGKRWLFLDAACPKLQDLLLYIGAVAGTIICLVYIISTRNDSVATQVISLILQLGLVLVIVSLGGMILGDMASVQAVYCNPGTCQKYEYARALRETGKLDGAEEIARTCIADISKDIIPEECASVCSKELSYTLFEKAGQIVDGLPGNLLMDEDGRCQTSKVYLDEAMALISNYDFPDLSASIEERKSRLLDKCVMVVVPTPTIHAELIRAEWEPNRVYFDVRVLENDDFLSSLTANDFLVATDGKAIPATVQERKADDSLCLVAVVDNSGSIYEGLDSMKTALQKLNDFRKPDDELGMVVFSKSSETTVSQSPQKNDIDFTPLDGTGDMTAIWDGVLTGLESTKSCVSDNRYLLLLTDGIDNDSRHLEGDDNSKARSIANQAIANGVDICVVGITDKVDEDSLKLAETGCDYYHADNFEAIADQIKNIFGYVYGFYRIELNPADVPEGSQLILRVKNSQGVPIDFNN